MEEIKVGDYIRTQNGLIGKLEEINKEPTDETITYIVTDSFQGMIEEIIKHSKNPIDLIEVGDLIKITLNEITNECEIMQIISQKQIDILKEYQNKHYIRNIKSIVTHEQFSNIEYRLED